MNNNWLWRVLSALCALLVTGSSACKSYPIGDVQPAYGPPFVSPVPLTLRNFSYTPAGPIHVGDTLTFTVEIDAGEIREAYGVAHQSGELKMYVLLHDDGIAPDTVAGDRSFTGATQWQASYGTGRMDMSGNASGTLNGQEAHGTLTGLPLEVEP